MGRSDCRRLRVRGRLQRPGTHLVEARAAVDRSVVPRREGHDGLSPTGAADRCMELARSFVVSRSLGRGATRRTALRIIDQTLAGIEGLLACREGELLRTVSTGQRTVLVHPSQTLLARTRRRQTTGPSVPERWSVAQGDCGRAPGSSGPCPGLIAEKIRVPSRVFERVPWRSGELGTRLVAAREVFEWYRGGCGLGTESGRRASGRPCHTTIDAVWRTSPLPQPSPSWSPLAVH
jgi:hypothetical protein